MSTGRTQDQRVSGIFPDERVFIPKGIVIPWLDGPDVELLNVRRDEGQPKYVAVKGSRRGGIYPGRSAIASGKPLVIVEGEFDALLLGQELGDAASVVTLGSASSRPTPRALSAMFRGHPWLVAVDADDAGERSARFWLELSGRCFRTAPPSGIGKYWSDAHQAGLDLRAHWASVLQSLGQEPSAHPERANTGSDPIDEDLSSDAEEYAPMDLILQGPSRWRCLNRYCLTKGRWWMSRYGVVRCMNCQPPSFPWLIIEEGDAAKAPMVERERSSQALGYPCSVSAGVSRSSRDSSPASVAPSDLPSE